MIRLIAIGFILLFSLSCRKVKLEEDFGKLDYVVGYHFAKEQVAYFFFRVAEKEARLLDSRWLYSYSYRQPNGGIVEVPFEEIDFSAGIHEHEVVRCSGQALCGSFSFENQYPLVSLNVRFQYDKDADVAISNGAFLENFDNDYSANLYGIFNERNERVQMRMHHNFPLGPSHDEVSQYGLKRQFLISNLKLMEPGKDRDKFRGQAVNQFLFPAKFCSTDRGSETYVLKSDKLWAHEYYNSDMPESGLCYDVSFLNRNGDSYAEAKAFIRKNPKYDSADLRLNNPLQEAIKIPIVLSYCKGAPKYDELTFEPFLDYQKYITGMSDRGVDLCFQIGKEKQFATEFKDYLATRLSEAKAANTSTKDYVFVLVFHERLNPLFHQFHRITSETIMTMVDAEISMRSPKLVGAFVYGTNTLYKPNLAQKRYIIWCPQELPENITEEEDPFSQENCITWEAKKVGSNFLNFKIPIGPFPSLSVYQKYLAEQKDSGKTKNPELVFKTVPSRLTTETDRLSQITYFESRKLAVADGEALRVCYEKDASADLYSFRFKKMPGEVEEDDKDDEELASPAMNIYEAERVWLDPKRSKGEYAIGMNWEVPFWAGLRYRVTGKGKIAFIVPFRKSVNQQQVLGGVKWQTTGWNLGRSIQYCRAYCDHPFFDEQGKYQLSNTWRLHASSGQCPQSKFPEWRLE